MALPDANHAADELLLMKEPLFIKRIAIVWFAGSRFGSRRKRPNWKLLILFTAIMFALLLLAR
ncbi:hypothetical protein ABIB00_007352 [Bradyrhizobium sp. LB14.3]|uniref:hypothetical protein n=1 Tax=Bradyrhizobium sp. LB14.3 TaxID=3156328 RepID=UPI003397606D